MATIRKYIVRFAQIKFKNTNLGLVNDVSFKAKPIELGRDSYGRTVIGGYDVTVECNLLECDNYSITNFMGLCNSTGVLQIVSPGNLIEINSVIMRMDIEIDGNGKPSKIKALFDRFFTADELSSIFKISDIPTDAVGPRDFDVDLETGS